MKKALLSIAVFFSIFSPLPRLCAQAGNDSPYGPAGLFNGDVTTAGQFDPYTGSASRKILDLSVAGAVGKYGLSYSRAWNSRGGSFWRHSFGWSIEDVYDLRAGQPIPYTVSFPDGRTVAFSPNNPPANDPYWRGPAGVKERFKPMANNLCYLILPDGGKVEFSVTWDSWIDYEPDPDVTYYNYYFRTEALIDPHGLRTTFTYNGNGGLSQVTEPAGRWIKLFYTTMGYVDYIQASDGRIVDYTYTTGPVAPGTISYTLLTSVRYFGDATLDARYSYQAPNIGSANGSPLLKSCEDSMYAGPMKKIFYTYATANNPNGTPPVFGQIQSENYLASVNPPTAGVAVSTLAMNTATTRTETRGDGPSRTFTYSGGKLTSSTDFKNVSASQTYDANGDVASVTDHRGKVTNFVNEPLTGNNTLTTFPLTPPDTVRATVQTTYDDMNSPYYVSAIKNERGHWTGYWRDAKEENSPDRLSQRGFRNLHL